MTEFRIWAPALVIGAALIQLAQSAAAPPPQTVPQPGTVVVPPSSVAQPGDAGVRAHTNVEIVVPPDHPRAPPPSPKPPGAPQ